MKDFSRAIEVIIPLNIASAIIIIALHPESVNMNWKAAIVPKSPILHPIRHHFVLLADCHQTASLNQTDSSSLTESQYFYSP